jgi:CelD/BcsL family acetyltransferase involved in cellulose biosynthesis
MEIVETRTSKAFTDLRDEWNELLARCERATIFQSWEWNEAWWRHFGSDKRLLLLQAREHGRLVGLAPFYVSRYPGIPLRRLAFVGAGISDYLDVLAPMQQAFDVCTAIAQYLTSSRDHDLVDLQDLPPTAVLREAMQSSPLLPDVGAAYELMWVDQEPCLSLALPSTWEAYLARLGKKMRRNVPYYRRLLERRCERVDFGLAGRAELPEAMSALFELHQKRWQRREQRGHLGSQQVQAFHRLVAERFHDRDWLRLHYIRVGGRIIAIDYAFRFRDHYVGYLMGFNPDPEWQHYSIGTVMTAEVIRRAIAEGCQIIDFLRGKEAYKAMWAPTAEAVNCRLLLRRRHSTRARAILWLDELPSRLAPVIKAKRRLVQVLQTVRDAIVAAKRGDTHGPAHAR